MKDNNKLSKGNKNLDYSLPEYKAILFGIGGLEPCFPIYLRSQNPKTLENLMRNPYLAIIIQIENYIPAFFVFYLH
jgi:hypothetical protein